MLPSTSGALSCCKGLLTLRSGFQLSFPGSLTMLHCCTKPKCDTTGNNKAIQKKPPKIQQQNEKKPHKFASLSSFSIACAGESSSPFHFPNAKSQALLLTSCIQTGTALGEKKPTSIYFYSGDTFPLNPTAEAAPGQLKSATSMAQSGCKVKLSYTCTAQTPSSWEVGMKNE